MRGADFVARTLAAAGARRVFALSGNHVMPVFDAALDAGLEIVHVRHEAAAVHMADAWGRLTNEVGVALVTGGPGHANAVAALYTALEAQSPVLLLSGHAATGELGRGAFQEMRQAELAAPVTRASWTVQSAATLGKDLRKALLEARLGPVHLSLPQDVLEGDADGAIPALSHEEPARGRFPGELLEAKRPLIVAGPAMLRNADVQRLEEASGVPVAGMESPRGVNDPALGRLAQVLARADAVLLLGKRLDFTLRFGAAFAPQCRVLRAEAIPEPPRKAREDGWLDEVREALAWRPPQWQDIRGSLHPVAVCR
ncbi:MAG TPA: thiamine pyrophosphate-binding protein, partial [Burkholderiales bacterium]|nr:thiamine pyrophosphate-binding protein [Burkholderiales bacterium]